jgi:hypothetical protein
MPFSIKLIDCAALLFGIAMLMTDREEGMTGEGCEAV